MGPNTPDPTPPLSEEGERSLRVVAHGGGVQSTALLVLSAQGKIDFPVHLFCNTGDDSEHPDTLAYVRTVGMPYAKANGIELHELRRTWKDGRDHTLLQHLTKPGFKGVSIPMRGQNGAPQARHCTQDFKIGVISKWLREHGATDETPATVGIGISTDEIQRAGRGKDNRRENRVYPLIELGLRRSDCHIIIADAGLQIPPKSACYFCPYHRPQVWAEMRRDRPDLFEKAAQLEDAMNARENQHSALYLTDKMRPLREAIGVAQDTFPMFADEIGEDGCDEGVCFV